MSYLDAINAQFTPESDKTDYFEGLTPGTGIPMFKGVETPAYGAAWSPEYTERWNDWYYRNGSIQNGMFVARGATPQMYQNHIALGAYNPAQSAAAATQYLEENPTPPWGPSTPDTSIRDDAAGRARSGIETAFRNYGITDLAPYNQNIEDRMARAIAGIPTTATDAASLDTYFSGQNLGPGLITELETPLRNNARTAFDRDIQSDYYNDTSDDNAINTIIGADRPAAEQYLRTMLDRGQILQPGYDAGIGEINRQEGLGRTRLNEIGANLMNTHEGVMTTERNRLRGGLDTLRLGSTYNPEQDDASLDRMASDFLGTLGTGLRSGLAGTPLFATSGLGAIAGAAQGGQNTTFGGGGGGGGGGPGGSQVNPTITPPDDDEDRTQQDILF